MPKSSPPLPPVARVKGDERLCSVPEVWGRASWKLTGVWTVSIPETLKIPHWYVGREVRVSFT